MSLLFSLLFFFLGFLFLFFDQNILVQWEILYNMNFFFMIDNMSLLFLSILFFIVSSVLCFSSFYMRGDLTESRFLGVLLLFVLSMIILILSPDLLTFLLGWDGLGVTSFLLILYYLTSNSWVSGFKTFLIKRLGDSLMLLFCSMLLGHGLFFMSYLDYFLSFLFIKILLFGLFTKSAQFPFCSWLPAAMAAPTPVSALVHSSTLVTAGIYMLWRNSSFFSLDVKFLLCVFGLWTVFIASIAGVCEWDCKKIIAFSTLSQLGLMITMISMGKGLLGMFHLFTHAVFKALLFMVMGISMYKCFHNQDLRFFRGFSVYSSLVFSFIFFSCCFSLCGLFFLSGFYSKEMIMDFLGIKGNLFFFLYFILFVPLTCIYTFRLFSLFFSKTSSFSMTTDHFSYLLFSLLPLFLFSLHLGFILNNYFKINSYSSGFITSKFINVICFYTVFSLFMSKLTSNLVYFSSFIGYMFCFKSSFFTYNLSNIGFKFKELTKKGLFSFFLSKFLGSLTSFSSKTKMLLFSFLHFKVFFWFLLLLSFFSMILL